MPRVREDPFQKGLCSGRQWLAFPGYEKTGNHLNVQEEGKSQVAQKDAQTSRHRGFITDDVLHALSAQGSVSKAKKAGCHLHAHSGLCCDLHAVNTE